MTGLLVSWHSAQATSPAGAIEVSPLRSRGRSRLRGKSDRQRDARVPRNSGASPARRWGTPRRESRSALLVRGSGSLGQLFCIPMAKEPTATHEGSLLLVAPQQQRDLGRVAFPQRLAERQSTPLGARPAGVMISPQSELHHADLRRDRCAPHRLERPAVSLRSPWPGTGRHGICRGCPTPRIPRRSLGAARRCACSHHLHMCVLWICGAAAVSMVRWWPWVL
jgi:hypothetical protein